MMDGSRVSLLDRLRVARSCWFTLLAAASAACATLPSDPVERGLYVDLNKAVELSNDTGWVVDRVQLENNAEDALRSVCQVQPERRRALDAWLGARLGQLGGSAASIYRRQGRELAAASAALELERVRALLQYADAQAAVDCPFWLEPDAAFRGVQSDAGRWALFAETVGYGSLVFEGGDAALGGGGGARVLLARGIGAEFTLAVGPELGGSGAFVANEKGTRTVETTFSAALPVVLRYTRFSRIYDLELGPIMRFAPDTDVLPPGLRMALAAGFSAMRTAAFMPYAMLWLSYEYHPADGRGPADHSLHVGTRVGVDWDP